MANSKRPEPLILKLIAELYEKRRKKIEPLYPYDRVANSVTLPNHVNQEIRRLLMEGNKPAAVKLVAELTGAGLRVSKDYVDNLARKS